MAMSFTMQGDATAALMLLPLVQRIFGGIAAVDPQLRPFVDVLQALLPNPNAMTATQARAMTEQMATLNTQMATLSKDIKDLTEAMKTRSKAELGPGAGTSGVAPA